MNCTQAEQLIPLDVSGDLPPSEADPLRQHIEACAHCRQLAEEFADSQAWMSELAAPTLDPKFDDAVFADLRASVLREIRDTELAEERGRWFGWLLPQWSPRFAVATALLLLILAGGLALSTYWHKKPAQEVGVKDPSPKTQINHPTPQMPVENHLASAPSEPKRFRASRHTQTPRSVVTDGVAAAVLPVQPTPEPAIEPAHNSDLAKAEPELMRIEIQTADPNIRIIWFAPKAEKTELNTK